MHATNKPFNIDKRLVYEAYKAVKSNRGAAGVDEQSIEQFEAGRARGSRSTLRAGVRGLRWCWA